MIRTAPACAALLFLSGCMADAPPNMRLAAPVAPPAPTSMVSSANPLATRAGLEILQEGGSAADAAIATLVALNVVEPQSSGIGGGGFLVYHDVLQGLATLDGRETAPQSARPDMFLRKDGRPMSMAEAVPGGKSVGVPGNVRLMAEAHRRYGKLAWKRLFQPAIALAEKGFVVSPVLEKALARSAAQLVRDPMARQIYFDAAGQPLRTGALVQNPLLAETLRQIADKGEKAFYEGPHAQALVNRVSTAAQNPARMTRDDLARYQVIARDPVCGSYRSYRICGMGPPSSGGIAVIQILQQIERFDLKAMGAQNIEAWHLIAESMRLAYADRALYLADSDFVQVPVKALIDKNYTDKRSALIDPARAAGQVLAGDVLGKLAQAPASQEEVPATSHFTVADSSGNVASQTSTIEGPFGSGLMVGGYFLNNELTDFNFVPSEKGQPVANRIAPRKRPRSSMSPTIVYDAQGKVVMALGAAGGPTIIAQVAKAIVGVVDWGLPVDDAIALPLIMGVPEGIRLEDGTWLAAQRPQFEAMGHRVSLMQAPLKANGVMRLPDGGWQGGADRRGEGVAQGF